MEAIVDSRGMDDVGDRRVVPLPTCGSMRAAGRAVCVRGAVLLNEAESRNDRVMS